MIQWLISTALGPVLNTLVKWRQTELAAKGSREKIVENLALRSLELDAQEARLNGERKGQILGKWHAPENLFAYLIAFPYWFTVITLDFLIFPAMGIEHATAPLKGETAAVMAMIMAFWFGKRTIGAIGDIVARVFGR